MMEVVFVIFCLTKMAVYQGARGVLALLVVGFIFCFISVIVR